MYILKLFRKILGQKFTILKLLHFRQIYLTFHFSGFLKLDKTHMIKEIYDIKYLFTLFLFFSVKKQLLIIFNRFLKIYARTCMNF